MDFGYYNMDCMDGMEQFPDKYFDLAIVDPPYFSGPERRRYYGRKVSPIGVQRFYEPSENWDVPGDEYFTELERVSKHQIVWAVIILTGIFCLAESYGTNAMGKVVSQIARLPPALYMIQCACSGICGME